MNTQKIDDLQSLIKHDGWQYISGYVREQIEEIEKGLFDVNSASNEVKYTEHDLSRLMREFLLTYEDLPSTILAYEEGSFEAEPTEA